MRKKIALLSLVYVLAATLLFVPGASAAYIFGTITKFDPTNLCRTAPDALTYKIEMKVKFKASGVSKPKKVRMGYQVMDADSNRVIKSGVVNLKKSKGYEGKTARITVSAGENIKYHGTGKFTVQGKDTKTKFTSFDTIPTVEQMDALPS